MKWVDIYDNEAKQKKVKTKSSSYLTGWHREPGYQTLVSQPMNAFTIYSNFCCCTRHILRKKFLSSDTYLSLSFQRKKKKKTQGKLHLFLFFYQLCHSLIQYSRTLIFVTSKTSFLFSISVFPLLFAKSKTSFFFSINVFPLCKQNDFALLSPQGVDNQVWRAFRGMILYASHFDVLCTRP